ncbi:hypothetical protein M768_00590 [Cellulosimicrobium cellulans F16]|uniref:Uncharacterized protein n=1 Tax=Cellulosimicrobium cellulans F16 TaxID=1350482 RepID=A0A0M0FA59_CELCE|nr:hypothetical protein M768_00590 [Cellulosimicrobium cellulans F16]
MPLLADEGAHRREDPFWYGPITASIPGHRSPRP